MLFHDNRKALEALPPEECGQLIIELLRYSETGESNPLPPQAEMAFMFMARSIDAGRDSYNAFIEKQRENGKKGGRPPKPTGSSGKPKKPMGFSENPKKPELEQELEQEETIPPLPPQGEPHVDLMQRRFNELWYAYPKKVGKGAALTALKKLKPNKQLFDQIMAAIHEAKGNAWFMRDKGQYIPNLSTWLNQTRWEDELPKGGANDGRTDQTDPGAYHDDDIPF